MLIEVGVAEEARIDGADHDEEHDDRAPGSPAPGHRRRRTRRRLERPAGVAAASSARSSRRLRAAAALGHGGADGVRRRVRPVELGDDAGRRSSPAPGRSCRAPRAARWRSSGSPCPRPASRLIRAWISALAPTSMPRVGSSMMRMRGLVASHLASTTFCWLPPESWRTQLFGPAGADAEARRSASRASRASCAPVDHEAAARGGRGCASDTFSRMVCGRISPCRPRSSGT